jgi:hypothetical protein
MGESVAKPSRAGMAIRNFAYDQAWSWKRETRMKKNVKTAPKRALRRDLFDELTEGVAALAAARHGKIALRTHTIE